MFPESFKQADGYANHFSSLASKAYYLNGDGGYHYRANAFNPPQWQKPFDALKQRADQAGQQSSGASRVLAKYGSLFDSSIRDWMSDNDIDIVGLFFKAEGNTAMAFEAQREGADDRRTIVRVGCGFKIPSVECSRAWCPLVLQPVSRLLLINRETYDGVCLELMPMLAGVNIRNAKGFRAFLNNRILAGTPYEVLSNKDLGVLFDGTPVYFDPDSLTYKEDLHRKSIDRQLDPDWQQEIMQKIDDNCAKSGLSGKLQWCRKNDSGVYETKQEMVHSRYVAPRQTLKNLRFQKGLGPMLMLMP